jgi:hypothetical protein
MRLCESKRTAIIIVQSQLDLGRCLCPLRSLALTSMSPKPRFVVIMFETYELWLIFYVFIGGSRLG